MKSSRKRLRNGCETAEASALLQRQDFLLQAIEVSPEAFVHVPEAFKKDIYVAFTPFCVSEVAVLSTFQARVKDFHGFSWIF